MESPAKADPSLSVALIAGLQSYGSELANGFLTSPHLPRPIPYRRSGSFAWSAVAGSWRGDRLLLFPESLSADA